MNHLIVIGGPTASGKTSLAIEVAQHFGTEVISADSRQFYREMRIGNARPTEEELVAVPHHFIADRSLLTPLSAGKFAEEAVARLDQIFVNRGVAVAVGGSGLYLRALCEGLDEFPEISGAAERGVQSIFEKAGLVGLQQALLRLDPDYYATVDLQNGRRLTRALKVCLTEGAPYSSYLGIRPARSFTPHYFALKPERSVLYDQIERRVETMLAAGLREEALDLSDYRELPVMQTVGYQEWWPLFDGIATHEQTIESIKRNSRRYAKRQTTWFRNYVATQNAEEIYTKMRHFNF